MAGCSVGEMQCRVLDKQWQMQGGKQGRRGRGRVEGLSRMEEVEYNWEHRGAGHDEVLELEVLELQIFT